MAETGVPPNEVHKLAKAHLLAKSAFNQAYCRFWHVEVKPCSDEMGWYLLQRFQRQVEDFQFKRNRGGQSIKQAVWEMFRLELVGGSDYSFEDVVGFVKWYGTLTRKISRAIGHLFEFHGDSF